MADVSDIIHELDSLKEPIAEAKAEKSEKVGQLKEKERQLKVFGVKDIKEAKAKLKGLEKQIADLEAEIIVDFETLKKEYEW